MGGTHTHTLNLSKAAAETLGSQMRLHLMEVAMLHVACYMLHVTCYTSHVTRHTSHVTRHTSHVTRHTSHVTRHIIQHLTAPAPSSTAFPRVMMRSLITPLVLGLVSSVESLSLGQALGEEGV